MERMTAGPTGQPLENPLIAPTPARLHTARIRSATGEETGLLVIHTPAGTTFVHLSKAEMLGWGAAITATGEKMSGLVVPSAGNGQGPGR